MTEPVDRSQSLIDPIDPARARALQAALGDGPAIEHGDPLPPFFHQIYFWDPQPPVALGRDGHPATGGFIPDMGLPRRMWAAGRLVFHSPLLAGIRAERISIIEFVTRKEGRSGPLAFVRVRHDFRQRGTLALTEWQELVYRNDPGRGAKALAPPVAGTDEDQMVLRSFDSTLLFRYSALTFNGHRIHYDEAYAREVEGYDGLVVHGPLLAQLLMLLAAEKLATEKRQTLSEFSYRATAPLMHHEVAELCWRADGALWVRGPDGRQCMLAQAR